MENVKVKFAGIDSWGRPVFKAVELKNCYIGDVNHLFRGNQTEEEVLKFYADLELSKTLIYFGGYFDCEPEGDPLSSWIIEIVRS